MSSLKPYEAFARANLAECCSEILEWENTAVLRNGKLRELASLLEEVEPSERLRFAQSVVKGLSLRFVANSKLN